MTTNLTTATYQLTVLWVRSLAARGLLFLSGIQDTVLAESLSGGFGEKSTFRFSTVFSRNQFPIVVRLKCPFPWELLVEDYSELLEATYLHQQLGTRMSAFFQRRQSAPFWLPLWDQLGKALLLRVRPAFKG